MRLSRNLQNKVYTNFSKELQAKYKFTERLQVCYDKTNR